MVDLVNDMLKVLCDYFDCFDFVFSGLIGFFDIINVVVKVLFVSNVVFVVDYSEYM